MDVSLEHSARAENITYYLQKSGVTKAFIAVNMGPV